MPFVGQQPQRVVGQQVHLPDAEGRIAPRLLRVLPVARHLPIEMQERLGLHVDIRGLVVLVGVQVHAREEEAPQRVAGSLPAPAARVVQHPVELLGRAVVAGVARVAELVGVAVQGPRRRQRLVRPAPIHHIHQVRFDPALDHVRVLAETREQARVLRVLPGEVADRQVVFAGRPARAVAVEPQPRKQHRQHPVHVQRLEVDVRQLLEAELPVAALERHQSASPSSASSVSTPSAPRAMRKRSWPVRVSSTSW